MVDTQTDLDYREAELIMKLWEKTQIIWELQIKKK